MLSEPQDPIPHPSALRGLVAAGRELVRHSGMLIVGWGLVGVGLLLMPTPVPVGLLLFLAGLAVLARESAAARRAIRWTRSRVPRMSEALNRAKPRLPVGLRTLIESTDPIADLAPGE